MNRFRFPLICIIPVLALLVFSGITSASEINWEFSLNRAEISVAETASGGSEVKLEGYRKTEYLDYPPLPYRVVNILIPQGQEVSSVRLINVTSSDLPGTVTLAPFEGIYRQDGVMLGIAAERDEVTGPDSVFPRWNVRYLGTGNYRGYRIASIAVYPVHYSLESGRLSVIESAEISVSTSPASFNPGAARRIRHVDGFREESRLLVKGMVENSDMAVTYSFSDIEVSDETREFLPSYLPSMEGSAVKYLIVTNEEMEPVFQEFADYKTRTGVPAVVRTTEWIRNNARNGVDLAETIRNFIVDAYAKWGVEWVLLGGDTDVIPERLAYTTFYSGEFIPTDMYYSCLDGDWNADGDSLWGEAFHGNLDPGDDADLYSEVYLGRMPVSTYSEAQNLVDKTTDYLAPADVSSKRKILMLGEVIFPSDWSYGEDIVLDGAEILNTVYTDHLAGTAILTDRLYENYYDYAGSVQLNKANAISYMEAGTNHVIHAGHGYKYNMSVGDANILNGDAWSLTNGDAVFSMYLMNCTNAAFDTDCLAEYFMLNPGGGAYAVTGSSRSAFPSTSRYYMEDYYNLLYDSSVSELGKLHVGSRENHTSGAASESSDRWTHFIYNLLGDPEAMMFSDSVQVFDVAFPAELNLGENNVTVTVQSGGAPFDSARVCLYKENDDYVYGRTDPSGSITFNDFLCREEGTVYITVNGINHSVFTDTIQVNPESGPFLRVVDTSVGDGSGGNGDGILDSGETVALFVKIGNNGQTTAEKLYGILSCADTGVTVTDSTVLYPDLAPSQQDWGASGFVFAVSPGYQDEEVIEFEIDIHDSTGGLWTESFALEVHAPEIELYVNNWSDDAPYGNGNGILEQGEDFLFNVGIKNFGTGAAIDLVGEITVPGTTSVSVSDGISDYGEIASMGVGYGDGFVLSDDDLSSNDHVILTLTDKYGRSLTEEIEFELPPAPKNVLLDASHGSTEMVVYWHHGDGADTLNNFMVYRSEQPGGPYTRVSEDLLHHTMFHDYDLESSSLYYYQIAAVDSCGNMGPFSAEVSATTNPPYLQGWPNKLAEQSSSSPKVADIDGDRDFELVIGAEYMYAWHHDGVEVQDGDNYPVTWGIFSTGGDNFTATPVLVDLDGQPGAEIVGASWNTSEIYVFDSEGNNLNSNWPKATNYLCWASPAAGDFDGDGDMEIAALDIDGTIYVWHGDGTELMDGDGDPGTDGVFFHASSQSNGWHTSTPSFADIDGDNVVELIFCANKDSVYCLNHDGTSVSGWPVIGADASAKYNASPAIGDIDDDGEMEVVIVNNKWRVRVYNHDGTELGGSWPRSMDTDGYFVGSPALADLTGDGKLEVVVPDNAGNCWIFRHDGSTLSNWPQSYDNGGSGVTESSPIIADINNDQSLDIILGCEEGWLNAWDITGNYLAGFPIKLKGYIRGTPMVKDLDQDGDVELIAASWDQNVYVWDLDAERHYNFDPWSSFHGNLHNNGWYHYTGVTGTSDIMFSYQLAKNSTVMTRWLVSSGETRWDLYRREDGGEFDILAGGLAPDQSGLILYEDRSAEEGVTYYYRLSSEDDQRLALETEGIAIPVTRARLHQNYPNPFNPSTRIDFTIPGSSNNRSNALLAVYDVRGALVKTLVNRPLPGGRHSVQWNGTNSRGSSVASGVYFARLHVGGVKDTRKMILLR